MTAATRTRRPQAPEVVDLEVAPARRRLELPAAVAAAVALAAYLSGRIPDDETTEPEPRPALRDRVARRLGSHCWGCLLSRGL